MKLEKSEQAILLLQEIVEWWDKWISSDNSADIEDPPIEEAKKLIAEMRY